MMIRRAIALALAGAWLLSAQTPEYTSDNRLKLPAKYREWIFLSSGLGMTYGMAQRPDPAFDNVFVAPSAYREFQATGHWPEKTMFILEVRSSATHGSINRAGHYQSDVLAVEAGVKDSVRCGAEKWKYFDFAGVRDNPAVTSAGFPNGSACWMCHSKNGAVENTFVQFYPTLLYVARRFGTFKPSYDPKAQANPHVVSQLAK